MADPGATSTGPDPARLLSIVFLGDPNSIHTRRWTGFLADRGHRITLIVGQDAVINPGLSPDIEIARYVPLVRRRVHLLGALIAKLSYRRLLRSLRPDVLHAHAAGGNDWAAWISGFHPYVVTVWGSDVLMTAGRKWPARMHAYAGLRGADLVTGTSQHLLDAAVTIGAKRDRTRLVHFGVDTERFRPGPDPVALRSRLGLVGRRVVFSCRTVAPLYHHETVVAALPRLPQDVVVLMTRHLADPVELTRIERQAEELGVKDRVVIVDSVAHDEMPDFYRLSDVVASVAESDGGPITVVEALAVGRPVVATNLPSVREWASVLDPRGLVPVGDGEATALAIEYMLGPGSQGREELVRRGRAEVLARADERLNMELMESLYRELAARRGRPRSHR
jgi:glycosyltransferase involved in cell wall biosynthesis